MTEKQYHVQRIYKGMDNGVKYYDWCVMKDDTVILRLSTRMDCKDVVEVLNKLSEENEKLHHTIIETEKMVQSMYDELTKLRCIKKNLGRIKVQWDWIMEAIQYD